MPKSERQPARTTVSSLEFRKASRKPAPLSRPQAYSILHSASGSEFHSELTQEYTRYISSDPGALAQYQHLFPPKQRRGLPFVTFQQAVIRDRFHTFTDEEKTAVDEFIDQRLKEETDLHQHPWRALRADDAQSDADLERQYVKEYVVFLIVRC